MKLDDLYFWQGWPVGRRKQYFRLMLLLWVALWAFAFTLTTWMSNAARKDAAEARSRYERVLPMAEEAMSLQTQSGNLAGMNPLATAQQVSRDLQLERKLASIRPTQMTGGQEGVQLQYEALNLPEMLALLDTLNQKGRLKVLSLIFNHRGDRPKNADLQLVLTR